MVRGNQGRLAAQQQRHHDSPATSVLDYVYLLMLQDLLYSILAGWVLLHEPSFLMLYLLIWLLCLTQVVRHGAATSHVEVSPGHWLQYRPHCGQVGRCDSTTATPAATGCDQHGQHQA